MRDKIPEASFRKHWAWKYFSDGTSFLTLIFSLTHTRTSPPSATPLKLPNLSNFTTTRTTVTLTYPGGIVRRENIHSERQSTTKETFPCSRYENKHAYVRIGRANYARSALCGNDIRNKRPRGDE